MSLLLSTSSFSLSHIILRSKLLSVFTYIERRDYTPLWCPARLRVGRGTPLEASMGRVCLVVPLDLTQNFLPRKISINTIKICALLLSLLFFYLFFSFFLFFFFLFFLPFVWFSSVFFFLFIFMFAYLEHSLLSALFFIYLFLVSNSLLPSVSLYSPPPPPFLLLLPLHLLLRRLLLLLLLLPLTSARRTSHFSGDFKRKCRLSR